MEFGTFKGLCRIHLYVSLKQSVIVPFHFVFEQTTYMFFFSSIICIIYLLYFDLL